MLPSLIDIISNKESSDEQITGVIYLLERSPCTNLIVSDWSLSQKFLLAMCNTSHVEKQSIQYRFVELFETYFSAFYHTAMDQVAKSLLLLLI